MPPGRSKRSFASISRAPGPRFLPSITTRPSLIPISQAVVSTAVTTVPLRITRSKSLMYRPPYPLQRPFYPRLVKRYCGASRAPREGPAMSASSPHRPTIAVTQHAISAGHYLAAAAGFDILQAGGNAIDAGCAAGIALGVLQSDLVDVAGVAPIMIYHAESQEFVTIECLGTWPKALDPELFMREHGGKIPKGVIRTVVPAAPDAWITALRRYGTMSFGEVAAAATRLARDGFPMYPLMADSLKRHEADHRGWPSSAAIFLPNGRVPEAGEMFRQTDLAGSLQYMADEERAASSRGREAGLEAARDAFYRGDIAQKIVAFMKQQGGLLSAEDLAEYRSPVTRPEQRRFGDLEVFTCGAWCQGPVLLQALALLEGTELSSLGQN